MEKQPCDYRLCSNEATTKGFVLVRDKEGNQIPESVWACDKHKNHPSFFKEK